MGIFSTLFGTRQQPKSPQQVEAENRIIVLCAQLERLLADNAPGLSDNFKEHKLVDRIVDQYRSVMVAYPNSTGELNRILGLFTEVYARTALTTIAKGLGLKTVTALVKKFGADASKSDTRGVIFIEFSSPPTADIETVRKIGTALKSAFEIIEPGSYADVDWLEPEGIGSFGMSRNWVHDCFFNDAYRKKLLRRVA